MVSDYSSYSPVRIPFSSTWAEDKSTALAAHWWNSLTSSSRVSSILMEASFLLILVFLVVGRPRLPLWMALARTEVAGATTRKPVHLQWSNGDIDTRKSRPAWRKPAISLLNYDSLSSLKWRVQRVLASISSILSGDTKAFQLSLIKHQKSKDTVCTPSGCQFQSRTSQMVSYLSLFSLSKALHLWWCPCS